MDDTEIDEANKEGTKKLRGKCKIYNLVESFTSTQKGIDYIRNFENARWKFKGNTSDKKYEIN